MDHVAFGCAFLGHRLLVLGLHGIDHDADEQVEDREGRDHDVGHEERPGVGKLLHHRPHDAHRPAFQGHDLEQRIGRRADGAEPFRKLRAEQLGRHHREHVVEQPQQRDHRAHAGQRGDQSADHPP